MASNPPVTGGFQLNSAHLDEACVYACVPPPRRQRALIAINRRLAMPSQIDPPAAGTSWMPKTCNNYALACRNCGQTGQLSITSNSQYGWSFIAIGFDGLAVNRFNPPNSVIRCNTCGSSIVRVETTSLTSPQAL
jgi:transcription elongation factor Elf1